MSLGSIFSISGSGMKAQSLRMTTTASNLSNSNVAANSEQNVYRPRYPVFESQQVQTNATSPFTKTPGVKVNGVYESKLPAIKRYEPNHPMADKKGYVFMPNVNMVEEMTNMISASRGYQMNIEVLSTAKQMMSRTLQLGQ